MENITDELEREEFEKKDEASFQKGFALVKSNGYSFSKFKKNLRQMLMDKDFFNEDDYTEFFRTFCIHQTIQFIDIEDWAKDYFAMWNESPLKP